MSGAPIKKSRRKRRRKRKKKEDQVAVRRTAGVLAPPPTHTLRTGYVPSTLYGWYAGLPSRDVA